MKKRKEIKIQEKLMDNNNIKHRFYINENKKNKEMNLDGTDVKKLQKSKSEIFL